VSKRFKLDHFKIYHLDRFPFQLYVHRYETYNYPLFCIIVSTHNPHKQGIFAGSGVKVAPRSLSCCVIYRHTLLRSKMNTFHWLS